MANNKAGRDLGKTGQYLSGFFDQSYKVMQKYKELERSLINSVYVDKLNKGIEKKLTKNVHITVEQTARLIQSMSNMSQGTGGDLAARLKSIQRAIQGNLEWLNLQSSQSKERLKSTHGNELVQIKSQVQKNTSNNSQINHKNEANEASKIQQEINKHVSTLKWVLSNNPDWYLETSNSSKMNVAANSTKQTGVGGRTKNPSTSNEKIPGAAIFVRGNPVKRNNGYCRRADFTKAVNWSQTLPRNACMTEFGIALGQRVNLTNLQKLSTARPTNSAGNTPKKGQNYWIQQVYESLREHGLSVKQARIMTAEVGRENSFFKEKLFSSHFDPQNKKINIGMISWQGARGKKLVDSLKSKGLWQNGKMPESRASIDAMVEFMLDEIRTTKDYARTKKEFLDNPDVDYHTGNRALGENYIRWRINDPNYSKGHQNRDDFYKKTADSETIYNAKRLSKDVIRTQQSGANTVNHSDNRKLVNVNINAVNVNTSAKTVSGNVGAAVKGVNNYLMNQIGASMT